MIQSARVGFVWALLLVVAGAAAGSPMSASSPVLQPFVPDWRVVLTGEAARDMSWMKPGWTLDRREISTSELDALEQNLLPALAADLHDEGSSARPCDYYRQYAAARWNRYHVILIHGFHRSYLDSFAMTGEGGDRWKHHAVEVTDGGDHFWDAVYVVELHRFTQMKKHVGPPRTVVFHGGA